MIESSSLRRMLAGMGLLVLISFGAVLGYVYVGWSWVDAFYFVVITVFSVGYGEVHPIDSTGLKLFTAFLIIAGCSTGIYVIGGFVQMIAEGEMQRAFGARKMSRGIQQLSNHAIICGYGRVGQILADELKQLGCPLVCVDTNKDRIDLASARGFSVVSGNAGEEDVLIEAGIHRARVLAAVLPDDAANVFITLTARELREDLEIIARGELIETKRKLLRSGANHVVLPAAIGASKIANMIAYPNAESLIADVQQRERLNAGLAALGLALREIHIEANSAVVNCKVTDIELSHGAGTIIAAIQLADGTIRTNPKPEQIISIGDILYVVSHEQTVQSILSQVQSRKADAT